MKHVNAWTIALFLLSATIIKAQSSRETPLMTVEERAHATTKWMTQELQLTPDQVVAVDSINLLFTKAQQIILQSAEGNREKIREMMMALEHEKETSLAKVLTENQLSLYKKKRDEMMLNRRMHP
jgi:hypothetical protein